MHPQRGGGLALQRSRAGTGAGGQPRLLIRLTKNHGSCDNFGKFERTRDNGSELVLLRRWTIVEDFFRL